VSDTPLPTERPSYWAATIKAISGDLIVGVIADNSIQMNNGNQNMSHETFCGVCVGSEGSAEVLRNSTSSANHALVSHEGDVLLFKLNPLQRQLTIMNDSSCAPVKISNVACDNPHKPVFITITMSASWHGRSLTQVELRQMTAAERAMMQ
jgi:hypothetical protein